jgi:hypothetical protein
MRTMLNLTTPWPRWPWWQHALAAALAVVALTVVGMGVLRQFAASAQTQHHALDTAQRLLKDLQARQAALPSGNFTQQLPPASTADYVARDLARFAEAGRVQIQSLTLQPQPATPRELGKVQFNINATADYVALKAWLAELLGRYPALAVTTLTLRSVANDGARLTSQVSLVLWVKD